MMARTNEIKVTHTQLREAASLINSAIENHATAIDVTGLGCLVHIFECLNIKVVEVDE
jgi:hypothetical protein